jgi:hypothetical protein
MRRFPEIREVSCRKVGVEDTLFGYWHVTVIHDAWCGHENCGIDGALYVFGSGRAALGFIAELPKSATEHQPVDYI